MNTLVQVNIKAVNLKLDHECIYINISHDMFVAKISINDLKSLATKMLNSLKVE